MASARSTTPQTVRWTNGPMHGAEVSCPPETVAKLSGMRLVITPGGKLYDRSAQRPVRGAEVVQLPVARRPKPTRRSKKR